MQEPVSPIQITLPVRQLVEFLRRVGSIDNRFTGFDRANEGARIHRKLQKAAGEGYQAEVFLSAEREACGIAFTLEGRADGIFTDENGTVTINGEVQQESYVVYQYAIPSEFDVPEGYYLFMGDNRANSMDSRYWQNPYVSGESIQGRAIFTLFPFSNFGKLQ